MAPPTVSVIIPAFNAAAFIVQSIESCLIQTLGDIEVLVVNDGSTDATFELARSLRDPRLQVFSQQNRGVSAARNLALSHARGRYVQFLDADDTLAPEKLAEQVKTLAAAGDCGLSTSAWGRFYHHVSDARFVRADDWKHLAPSEFLILEFGGGGTMPPNSWLVPRRLLKDFWFVSAADAFEDSVALAVLSERSERIVFCDSAVSYYRSGNPLSLSAGKSTLKCLRQFMASSLVVETMLRVSDTIEMRRAAANLMMRCAVDVYPILPSVGNQAEVTALRYGRPTYDPSRSADNFGRLSRIIGWKTASVIRHGFRHTLGMARHRR